MKSEHEKLKEICDKIGYKSKFQYFEGDIEENETSHFYRKVYDQVPVNVIEIIFTPEFMDRLGFYLVGTMKMDFQEQQKKQSVIIFHLNDPVYYLTNLIKA